MQSLFIGFVAGEHSVILDGQLLAPLPRCSCWVHIGGPHDLTVKDGWLKFVDAYWRIWYNIMWIVIFPTAEGFCYQCRGWNSELLQTPQNLLFHYIFGFKVLGHILSYRHSLELVWATAMERLGHRKEDSGRVFAWTLRECLWCLACLAGLELFWATLISWVRFPSHIYHIWLLWMHSRIRWKLRSCGSCRSYPFLWSNSEWEHGSCPSEKRLWKKASILSAVGSVLARSSRLGCFTQLHRWLNRRKADSWHMCGWRKA